MNLFKLSQKQIQSEILIILGIALFAFLVRVAYLFGYLHTIPTAVHPMNDAKMYWDMGINIYRRGWLLLGKDPFYQAPLYSYFLAGLHHLGVHAVEPVLRLQIMIGTANVILTYLLARFYLESKFSALAAILFSLSHLVLFYETKLLASTFGLFLFLIFALLFLLWITENKIVYMIFSAIFLGLAILCQAFLLFTLPCILIFIFLLQPAVPYKESEDKVRLFGAPNEVSLRFLSINLRIRELFKKDNSRALLLFFLLTIFTISAATVRNYLVSSQFIPICANSGVTLYMGTNDRANGGLAPVPGLSNNIEDQVSGGIQLASQLSGKNLSISESSNFWIKKTISWVLSNPIKFMILESKKLLWSVYYTPPAVNDSVHFEGEWLRYMQWFSIFTWLLTAVGLTAVPLLIHSRINLFILTCWAGYILLSLVYYASDRFLVTMLPFCSVTTALFIKELLFLNKSKLISNVVLLIFFALVTINPFLSYNRNREIGFGYYNLGVYYGNPENKMGLSSNDYYTGIDDNRAKECYQKALLYLPNHPSSLLNLGVLYARSGDKENSNKLFLKVLQIDPSNETAKKNLLINQNR